MKTFNPIKKEVVGILTSSPVGRLIELFTNNQIRYRNVLVNTVHSEISKYIKACLFWGLYEKQEAKFIQKYLSSELPVIELGASIGVISSLTAKKAFPQQVYSVEANPRLIPIIENNLKINQVNNCRVMNVAIGDAAAVFFTPGSDNTVGTITRTKYDNSVAVNCLSLSGIISQLGLNKFNLVCDIEGSEVDFLFRDSDSLSACELMIIELHDGLVGERHIKIDMLKDQIVALGFSLIDSHGPVIVAKRV
jgi:FkbM family methyltransferase